MKLLITGGAGFIGSALTRHLVIETGHGVVNVDALTYAANPESLADLQSHPRYVLERADIGDFSRLQSIFAAHRPDAILHLAAESHVDRSIDGPAAFIQTNVVGTFTLLQAALAYWRALPADAGRSFRFLHVSTDEVFGSLGATGRFDESTAYAPNSPYSASKASSDHLVRAWHHTYGLPTLISNCSNNYGPRQFPEKLIPKMILSALTRQPLPVYGRGENVRDWLYVEDHVRALMRILERGEVGATYAVGGECELRNIDVVRQVCRLVDEMAPELGAAPRESLVRYVTDRPGHDLRYAIDSSRLRRDLDWQPREDFASGLRRTVQWYLENASWWQRLTAEPYRERLGLRG